jgi:serine protease Do
MDKRFVIFSIAIAVLIGIIFGAYNPQIIGNVSAPSSDSTSTVKVASEESVTIGAVKKVGPSVVTITGTERVGPFGDFGFQFPDQVPQRQKSVGTGFIYSSDGLIITNKHVVSSKMGTYQVVTANNKKYSVKNIYRDPVNDIAIIKIDPKENTGNLLPAVSFGDSSHLQVGQFVIAIGTALGEFRNTVTTGVISGLGRGIDAGDQFHGSAEHLDNVIQTDAPINPGNSGGPLVNSSSQVIGMNTAIAQNGQNIGFAIPINSIKSSLNNFQSNGGQFARAFLGVSYTMISQSLGVLNDLPAGAYVQSVVSDSPAEKAGIQQGDIIIKLGNQRIGLNDTQLSTIINKKKVGDKLNVYIWRDGKTMNITATLENADTTQ